MSIDSSSVLYSRGKNDEHVTPEYAVWPLVKYVRPGMVVWCPFDKYQNSNFARVLGDAGCIIECSHIDTGQDFYEFEPLYWDVMISNPPFTGKRKIFERALSFRRPFALLMSNTWLNDAAPKQVFYDHDLQLLMFDKRIEFDDRKKITFSSSYFCYNFLPKQIIMERIETT